MMFRFEPYHPNLGDRAITQRKCDCQAANYPWGQSTGMLDILA